MCSRESRTPYVCLLYKCFLVRFEKADTDGFWRDVRTLARYRPSRANVYSLDFRFCVPVKINQSVRYVTYVTEGKVTQHYAVVRLVERNT